MSGFLDELERELVAAHPRRRRARRRMLAARASTAMAFLAIVGVAGLFVLSVGRESTGGSASRPSSAEPGPAPAGLPSTAPAPPPEAMPAVPPGSVAVLDGTTRPGLAEGVANFIRPRYEVGFIGLSARREATRTVVFHEPEFRRAAELVAQALGASLTTMDATARDAARGAGIVVEIGRDIRGAESLMLHAPGSTEPRGGLTTLRRADRTLVTMTPKLSPGRLYATWTRSATGRPAKFLGFLPEVRAKRPVVVTFVIRTAARGRELFITRQRSPRRPRSPGPTVLTAGLP